MESPSGFEPFADREKVLEGIFYFAEDLALEKSPTVLVTPGTVGRNIRIDPEVFGLSRNLVPELAEAEYQVSLFMEAIAAAKPWAVAELPASGVPEGFSHRMWLYADRDFPQDRTVIHYASTPLGPNGDSASLVIVQEITSGINTQTRLVTINGDTVVTTQQELESDDLLFVLHSLKQEGDEENPESFFSYAIAAMHGSHEGVERIINWPYIEGDENTFEVIVRDIKERYLRIIAQPVPEVLRTEEAQLKQVLKRLKQASEMPAPAKRRP